MIYEIRALFDGQRFSPMGSAGLVMFQIVNSLTLDVPAITDFFRGVSPDVLISSEPWGHVGVIGSYVPWLDCPAYNSL